jgi:hypothetical protein
LYPKPGKVDVMKREILVEKVDGQVTHRNNGIEPGSKYRNRSNSPSVEEERAGYGY